MTDLPGFWARFIAWIGDGTGLPDAILHIHAGMAVLIASRLLTGRGLGTYSMKLFGERYLGGRVSVSSQSPEGTVVSIALRNTP